VISAIGRLPQVPMVDFHHLAILTVVLLDQADASLAKGRCSPSDSGVSGIGTAGASSGMGARAARAYLRDGN